MSEINEYYKLYITIFVIKDREYELFYFDIKNY